MTGTAVVGVSVSAAVPAVAADWTFSPYIGIGEQYTDNALSTSNNRKSDFITSLNAGFTVDAVGNRLNLHGSYDGSYDFYSKYTDLNGFRHNLLASGNAELVQEHLFVDSQIAYTEETLNRSGNTAFSDRTGAGDRTQVLNSRISPYYMHDFGGFATGIARYTYSQVTFSNPDTGGTATTPNDSYTNAVDLKLESGRHFARTKWALEGNAYNNQVDNGDDLRRASFKGTGQMPINKYVALLGTTGWDEFDGDNIDNDAISGAFYGGGVRLTPGPRTDFSLQVGHRYGGGIVDADLTYLISSEAAFTASYNVDIVGAGQSLADTDVLDTNGELVDPNRVTGTYVDSIAKAKTAAMGLRGEKGRNTYSATASYITREFLDTNTNDKVVSFDGSYARQLSRQLELALSAGYSRVIDSQFAGGKDRTFYGRSAFNYQFTESLSGTVSYSYFNRDSETPTDSLRENNISVSIKKAF
ncbi:MAG: TIGR03016 family PEP-CTERM system-associated outer membrane protein [Alphaproteobacteria bacterium]|nr:MAG: TIGR03016 family PEP-CTERM system-associated outer membrane protein [Alphaproteobacteria bacterium]